MVSKHSKLAKRQAWDHYERLASPSSRTAPSPLCHKVGSSSHCRIAPPPLRQEEASSDDSVEMWVIHRTVSLLYAWWLLLLRRVWWLLLLLWHTWRKFHPTIPPRTPWAIMMNAPTSKRWAHLYELVLDFNCLVELLNVHTFISD
jgi:hypothetical protein